MRCQWLFCLLAFLRTHEALRIVDTLRKRGQMIRPAISKRSQAILPAVGKSGQLMRPAIQAVENRVPAIRRKRKDRGLGSPIERVKAYWKQDDSELSLRLAQMIKVNPSLERPTYNPTSWAKSSKANFALAFARSRLGELRRKVEPPLIGRFSDCEEPDLTVEWAKDDVGYSLPPDAPIVIFLHTITGTAAQTRWLMSGASARGWRSCVFVRRGHGGRKLTSPSFNLLGDVGDVEDQLAAVRRAYPNASFVGMIGISAGSGLLISYLGRAGGATPVGAACAICPAWDVSTAVCLSGASTPRTRAAPSLDLRLTRMPPPPPPPFCRDSSSR